MHKQMEIFPQSFQYTPSNPSDFIKIPFNSTINVTIFVAKCY